MTIYQRIAVTEICLILIINENSSGKILIFLICQMKILVIVSSLYHRIADTIKRLHIDPDQDSTSESEEAAGPDGPALKAPLDIDFYSLRSIIQM